jgi:hypothetical protein
LFRILPDSPPQWVSFDLLAFYDGFPVRVPAFEDSRDTITRAMHPMEPVPAMLDAFTTVRRTWTRTE